MMTSAATGAAGAAEEPFDWRGEYASALGTMALVYGFPYVYNARIRHKWVTAPVDPQHVPYSAVNEFWHAPGVIDASFRDGGCPNNDTLYSVAWVDLTAEPIVLSHPDMGDRDFSFELSSAASDNFDYVGQRTTGSATGDFLIAGPGWSGAVPHGLTPIAPSPTPWILCLGRTLVDGAEDLEAAHALMSGYRLTPLSAWGDPDFSPAGRRDVLAPIEASEDPLGPWKALNAMPAENPPPPEHAVLLRQFAEIGIGPGLDPEAQPAAVKAGLGRALATGMQLLPAQFLSGEWARAINGWRYPPPEEGRFGDDFLRRAADQSLAGIVANDPAEAVYLVNRSDADGGALTSDGRYQLRFAADDMPPVDSFWSLTMYAADMNLVPNPVDRYAVGDRTPGLVREPDGALSITIQAEAPEGDANWLPCPAEGTWFVILRLYRPRPRVLEATWRCPRSASRPDRRSPPQQVGAAPGPVTDR
jgi:hypothetical protein